MRRFDLTFYFALAVVVGGFVVTAVLEGMAR